MIIVVAAIAVAGYFFLRSKKSSDGPSYVPTVVKRERLEVSILATGTVQPENRLEIKPPIAGRIERVLVDEGAIVRKGQVLAWMSSTERAALLDAASAKGPAELKEWEELYKPTPILAPINGTIILRNVESGQAFATTDPILVMSDRLTVKAQVDETDIAQIQAKQDAGIVLDAYPGKTIPARVGQIAYEAKTVNNVTTYIVDVLPNDTPPTMRAGMTANVTFAIAAKEDALVVPVEAVKARDGTSTVLVAGERPKKDPPIERKVETGLTDGKRIEIVAGLTEGDTVLVPEFKLDGPKNKGNNPFAPTPPGGRKKKGGF
jgi:macrolide-specific efflux system membrane fusion protein